MTKKKSKKKEDEKPTEDIKDFKISTDKYQKSRMERKIIKYEIKN
jgi:hypothetical protein